jgi:MDMPI C-terminal domain
MFDGLPPEWGALTPEPGRTVRITATDAGTSWHVTVARFTGTDPDGNSYDEPAFAVADLDPGTPTAAGIAGSAADLDAWLWGRPPLGSIERSGDPATLAGFDAVIAAGIN